MKSGRQTSAAPQAASAKKGLRSATLNTGEGTVCGTETATTTAEITTAPVAGQDAVDSSTDSSNFARTLETWCDQIFHFFARHRATTALVTWAGVSVFDMADMRMPAEWLVFTFFSFSVFVQAFGMSILLFTTLATAMSALNVAVYYFMPFSVTSLLSTVVVSMLLVRGVHGLDSKGWAVTALMSLSRLSTPWCEILPEYLQAPVAAYCASFGLLWIVYHSSARLESLLDPLCMMLGVIPPLPPRLSIVEIGDTSVVISWAKDFSTDCLLTTASGASNGPGGTQNGTATCMTDSGSLAVRVPRSNSNPLLASMGGMPDQPLSPLALSAGGKTPAPSAGHATSTSDSIVKIGGLITIDRKQLSEARVMHYEVEVDGRVVGKCVCAEEITRIQGLPPASTHQIRVWAISNSRGRAPSVPIFVKTLSTRDAQAQDSRAIGQPQSTGGEPVTVSGLRQEITDLQKATREMEDSITALQDQANLECGKLQADVSELRTKRKVDESDKAMQRDKLRELEARKRWLEGQKAELVSNIAESAARKQRALDRRREKAKQAEEYRHMTSLVYEKMDNERRDYEHEQSELVATIDALKLEVDKANQHTHELSQEQADVASQLQRKRAELSDQNKAVAELEGKLKMAIQKRRRIKTSQKEAATTTTKLQAEADSLKFQLEEAVVQRQQLETIAAETHNPPPYASAAATVVARPPPIHPASYSAGTSKRQNAAEHEHTYNAGFPIESLPARLRSIEYPAVSNNFDRAGNRQVRSQSFKSTLLNTSGASSLSPFAHANQTGLINSGLHLTDATSTPLAGPNAGHSSASFRRSADLGDFLGPFHSSSPKLTAGLAAPSGHIQPLHFGQSNATSTRSLLASGSPILALSRPMNAAPVSSICADSPNTSFAGLSNSIAINRDMPGHLGHATFWRSQSCTPESSMSTTTAEASALSILKDTDLAYPTPQRPSYGGPELFGSSSAFTRTPSLQPPTEPHAAYSNTLHRAHLPLSNIFARSLDVIEPPARTAHGRYASADKRASSSGWLESSYVPQRLSMGSSTIVGIESERNSCDLDRDLDRNDGGSFLARTASPAEQPQDLFSSGVLGVHSFPGVSAAPAAHRPLVEPIGAPSRRRCGPSLGALSTRSHDHLPFDDVRQPMYTKNRPTQSTGTRSCRTSMDHDIVSSPPVDNSLYQRRSFWEHDSADIQK